MKFDIKRTIRYYYIRFKRLQGNPGSLALGSAIGILIGLSPTLPLHTVLIVSITLLFRASTIAALISATVVSNPLTFALQYYICWLVGDWILPEKLTLERMQEVLNIVMNSGFKESLKSISMIGLDAVIVMLTGGLIIGIPLAIASYFLTIHFFIRINAKRKEKHILN